MILALDLGMTTGWARTTDDGTVYSSGVWCMDGWDVPRAYSQIREDIEMRVGTVSLVAYEDVPASAHRGGDAAHRWGGFEAIVLTACYRHRKQYLGVKPAQWKRVAGLRSGSGPEDALRAAQARWPDHVFATDDEAVARWVALAATSRVR